MAKNFLDLDIVPIIEELCELFKKIILARQPIKILTMIRWLQMKWKV